MASFGTITSPPPFGSPLKRWECFEIWGERGTWWEKLIPRAVEAVGGAVEANDMYIFLKGEYFRECQCYELEWGEQPPICIPPSPWDSLSDVRLTESTDSATGEVTNHFLRITKCEAVDVECSDRTYIGWEGDGPNFPFTLCSDYAKCCLKGRIRYDKGSWGWTPWTAGWLHEWGEADSCVGMFGATDSCGRAIGDWLRNHGPDPRCKMEINCEEIPPQVEDNADVKCNKYVE